MNKKREIIKCIRCQVIISDELEKGLGTPTSQRTEKILSDIIDDKRSQKILNIEIELSFSCCPKCQKTITPETANYLARQKGLAFKKPSD